MMTDHKFVLAVDGSGDKTVTDTRSVSGRLVGMEIENGDLDAGTDITVSVVNTPGGFDRTLITLTNVAADAWHEVRALGADATGASSSEYVNPLVFGNLRVVAAQGGVSKTGTVILYVEQ